MKNIKVPICLALLIVATTTTTASEQQTEKTHVEQLDDQYIRYMIAQAEKVGIARKEKCEASIFGQGDHVYIRMTCPKTSFWGQSEHETLHTLYAQQMAATNAYFDRDKIIKEQRRLDEIKKRLTERGILNALDAQELSCPINITLQQAEQELEKVINMLNGMKKNGNFQYPLKPDIYNGFFSSEYRGGRGVPRAEYNVIAKELREQDAAEQAQLKTIKT